MKQFTLIAQDGDFRDEFETDSLMNGFKYAQTRGYEGVEVINNESDDVSWYINTLTHPWLTKDNDINVIWVEVDEDTFEKKHQEGVYV